MKFQSGSRPMGAELPLDAPRRFLIEVDGTASLRSVELLRDGRPLRVWSPGATAFSVEVQDACADPAASAFYLVRAEQTDKHKGWTSPIWFG
jgi:hypothetical protein